MADLVADDGAHGAVVVRGVRIHVEERGLDDSRGKVQRVLEREIDGIDGLRGHPPFTAVDGLVEFRQLAAIIG